MVLKKRIVLIGLGKQNTQDHLAAIQHNKHATIVAVCDIDKKIATKWASKLKVKPFTSVEAMLQEVSFDAAVVAVPHYAYLPIIKALAGKNISILKEKPLAISYDEALEIAQIVQESNINLTVAVQRKHNKVYKAFQEYVTDIGKIFSIHGHYTLDIKRLDSDWRSNADKAGGGAVIDMGYHLLDLIVWYFGLPDRISAELGYHNRTNQSYDVEDTAKIQFSYKAKHNRRILGSLLLSRIYPEKDEALTVYGTKGTIVIYKDRIELYTLDKQLRESIYIKANGEDLSLQFDTFIQSLDDKNSHGNYVEHLENMVFIDAIYRSDKDSITVTPFNDSNYSQIKLKKSGKVGI